MSVRLERVVTLDSRPDAGRPCAMAHELDQQLPRGVAVSKREAAAPWRVDVDARLHASIHVVVRGSFYLAQDEHRVLPLGAGDIVLIGAGAHPTEPRLHCVAGAAELISAVYAPFNAPDRRPAPAPRVAHLSAADVRREPGLLAILSSLRAELMGSSAGRERLSRSLLEPLLAYVLHCHEHVRAGDLAGRAARPVDGRVARVLQIIEPRLAERWTVESLARAAGLSRAAFARRFLAEVGVPPLRYLAERRMLRATELLAEGDGSLASIAAEVGYDSEFAFSRAFKRHTGEAPSVLRRRRRAEGAALRPPPIRAAA